MTILYERFIVGDDGSALFADFAWEGQSFTIGNTGIDENFNITSLKLLLYRTGSPGTITVSIRAVDGSSLPTGADLSSGTTNGNTLPTDSGSPEWREVTMSTYELVASTQYAIVVRAVDGTKFSQQGHWKYDQTSPTYTGGARVFSSNSGSSWTENTTRDFMFEIYGLPTLRAYVAATNTSNETSDTTSHTITLPAGISAGDLLIIFFASDGDNTISDWDGFTEIFNKNWGTANSLSVAWKKAAGSDSNPTITTTSNETSSHITYRIKGAKDPSITPPEASIGVLGSSSAPNPDNLTPSENGGLWIAACGVDVSASSDFIVSGPYSNLIAKNSGSSGGFGASATDHLISNVSSENPGAFGLDGGSDTWVACTVACFNEVGAAGTNMSVNVGDVWKDVSDISVNVGDSWKTVTTASVNVGDAWKTIF